MRIGRDQRYDRQLRLWGDHGQFAIEKAKVCLIRASAVGSEILKNLVLPGMFSRNSLSSLGIGSFTIVDDSLVCEEDLGSNFFVTQNSLNKSRAQIVTENLCELNESVSGNYVVEDFNDLLENDPQFFLGFNIIIVTDAREGLLIRLSRLLQGYCIPIIVCISIGIIGYLRVSAQEHVIVESHPDSTKPDLRLDNPPTGLVSLANEQHLETMNAEQLSHTPWLIIIHLFVQQFIKQHGHFPQNHKDKSELKRLIHESGNKLSTELRQREPTLDASFSLDNFAEAARAVNLAVCPTEIPQEVRDLFEDERCFSIGPHSDSDGVKYSLSRPTHPPHAANVSRSRGNAFRLPLTNQIFWRLVSALRDFVHHEGGGQLPVRGNLPDMTSDSVRYLRLLSIYREQSDWAVECIASRVKQFPDITLDDVRLFVRNAAFLRVVRCRSLEEEMKLSPARSEDLALIPTHKENDAMLWYIVLRGATSFVMETGRWPGSSVPYTVRGKQFGELSGDQLPGSVRSCANLPMSESNCMSIQQSINTVKDSKHLIDSDLPAFRTHLNRVLHAFGITPNRISWDYVDEMCRFGGGELHSVSSFMGGIVAQEVIKLITHQFVPICKPLLYNAITQRIELLDF
ncbi:Amyloid beta protein binding protein 1 [Fasciola hepatica]|uniref:NEDD8-activating enzyme E1 regulatory subunit n=1 Tax=Fasciola hepatica TaxID=6192 RepID=A0A4E0QZ44_FASHE|nr:Amyloid beta protein binding protein 1 [Fasciola hepatica]